MTERQWRKAQQKAGASIRENPKWTPGSRTEPRLYATDEDGVIVDWWPQPSATRKK